MHQFNDYDFLSWRMWASLVLLILVLTAALGMKGLVISCVTECSDCLCMYVCVYVCVLVQPAWQQCDGCVWWSAHSRLTKVMRRAWLQLILQVLAHLKMDHAPTQPRPHPNTINSKDFRGHSWHLIYQAFFFDHLATVSKIYAMLFRLKPFFTLSVILTELS